MSAPSVLAAAVLVLTGLVVALAATIALQRGLRRRTEARVRRLSAPLRPLLLELTAGEPEEQHAAWRELTRLDAARWRAVEPAVVAMLGKVRGESLTAVVRLLDEQGVLRRARHDLGHRSGVRRAAAADLLGTAGGAGARVPVKALVDLLSDPHEDVRLVAARALGHLGDPAASAHLVAALASTPAGAPVPVVAQSLLRIGLPGAPALLDALGSPSPLARTTAAEVLGRVGAVAATGRLAGLLVHDAEPLVRARAATALGRLGMPSALPGLVSATDPAAPAAVRAAATRALGELGDLRALDRLVELIADPQELVAAEAGPALLRLGPGGRDLLRAVAAPPAPAPALRRPAAPAPAAAAAGERAREALAMAALAGGTP